MINRQRGVRFDSRWLRKAAALALPRCVAISDDGAFALRALPEVLVAIVSDARIERVHLEFMGIAGATDVITFEHGELVVSAETAAREAAARGHRIERELLLYTIHGLLHLNGFDDLAAAPAVRMRRAQARVQREVLTLCPIS